MGHWTSNEILFLTENYPIHGKLYCVDKLGRTERAIVGKASKLGIKCAKVSSRYTHEWYESELFRKEINIFPIEPYITSDISILHTCLYDHEWLAPPNRILSGSGCPHCYGRIKLTTDQYRVKIPKGYILHGEYLGTDTPIEHEHILCGMRWLVRPHDLLAGSRCPNCSTSKIKYNLPTILYLVKWGDYFKLGITSKEEVRYRFRTDWAKFNMEVVWQINFSKGKIAYTVEQNMLKSYKHLLVNTGLLISGNTETLTEEILCPV